MKIKYYYPTTCDDVVWQNWLKLILGIEFE